MELTRESRQIGKPGREPQERDAIASRRVKSDELLFCQRPFAGEIGEVRPSVEHGNANSLPRRPLDVRLARARQMAWQSLGRYFQRIEQQQERRRARNRSHESGWRLRRDRVRERDRALVALLLGLAGKVDNPGSVD